MDTAAQALRSWPQTATEPACRLCGARLHRTLIDLGDLPLANRTEAADTANHPSYRLHIRMCDDCTLVQTADVPVAAAPPEPHRPARSTIYLNRARHDAETMRKRLRLDAESLVIEIGASDGTVLHPFQAAGIPILGIGPVPNAATDIPTRIAFFDTETAMEVAVRHGCADLVYANNVLPFVPDLFDFAAGVASILRPNGIFSVQVPHLLSLLQATQFDAFRHDAYSYLSLRVLEHVSRSVGLRVFDAERLPDHGGTLRVHACHVDGPHAARPSLKSVRQAEGFAELDRRDIYSGFSARFAAAQSEFRDFLQIRCAAGRRVAVYGTATRGNMLLNCCGITTREIACAADPDPAVHGRLLPGSQVPIVPLQTLMTAPPDDLIILPWPDAAEIVPELTPLRQLGTHLWIPIPRIVRV
ncbi:class I SAM-dependent methyltransferase [Acidisphaera sp. S103]|uniref:class I SAM-dependent methyltransferase n=1 Tax=Acidisphaera sp. S103 TaxID=1747223 RepID=UPI00131BE49F|nr:class I SAM-dependent methyltransferase [Acidisphaera sp. S103]